MYNHPKTKVFFDEFNSICNTTDPCDIGQGHCKKDSDCKSGLKCG